MKKRVHHLQVLFVLASLLLCALNLSVLARRSFAQAVAVAEVSGVVADPSGAAVAGAQVKVTETEQQWVRTTTTDDQGRYILPNLPVGPYELMVTANGFKSYVQSGIVLQVGNNVQINVALELGSLSESVKVTAAAGMVETRENSVSQVIDQARIVDLPLNGRAATQLILLAGAANSAPNGELISSKGFYSAVNISVAGGQVSGVNYLLDGGENIQNLWNVNMPFPFPDALQEFSVDASSLPARYGSRPGGVVNAVTKSGTNDWHGDLFEFLRNGDVNARNFFAPAHDSLKRNQFGGTVGSKIIRDKLFFFGGFQGTFNRSDPASTVSYVPTAAVLAGDFSAFDSAQCISGGVGKTLVDPTTGQPFPNNQIPVSRLNQQSLNLAKYLPAAQNVCGQVTYGIPFTGDEDQVVGRVDWLQSSKHSFFGRYFVDDWRNPQDLFGGRNLLETTSPGNLERAQTFTLGDTYAFSGTTVNAFHATASRVRVNRGPAADDISPSTIGVNIPEIFPNFIYASVTGYFAVGCGSCSNAYYHSNAFHYADDVDIIRGKHQIAFGVQYIRNQTNNTNGLNGNGDFTFNGQYASGKTVNDALAAYMLGVPNDFTQTGVQYNATRATAFGSYAQDTIRLTQHLTVNAGLRWDPFLAPYDYFGRGSDFYPAAYNAGQRSQVYTNAPVGLLFYGDPGIPKGFQHNQLANFSPRLGIVWDPDGKGRQTIRVSAGIVPYSAVPVTLGTRIFGQNAPYASTVDLTYPAGGFSNPWAGYPGGAPFPVPSPPPKNFTFPSGAQYSAFPLDPKTMSMAQWNLSYQRQITPDWLASVSYLGNKTTHIWTSEDINPGQYIPGSSASLNNRRPLYLKNPTTGAAYAAILMSDQGGNSNYSGLLLSLQHRFRHGVTLLTNYTWSHCISDVDYGSSLDADFYQNPYNRAADRGNCVFDVRQSTNTSLIVVSPVKGNGFADRVLRNWQIAPIVTIHSGLPLNVTDGVDISQTGIGLDRPNLILPNTSPSSSNPLNFINRAAFQTQAAGTFGNLGRDVVSGPGTVNFDFSLSRTFRLRERWQLEGRAEAFNVINHPNFVGANPTLYPAQTALTTTLSSSTFGQIQNANDPRILQFALKLHF
jgi:hypothetical protein